MSTTDPTHQPATCPKCGHAWHERPCLNMASDNDCRIRCETSVTAPPTSSAVDLAELVAAPPGHEWRELEVYDAETSNTNQLIINRNGVDYFFVARPVVPWPTTPGEYRMRRADGVVVTALLDTHGCWTWLTDKGRRACLPGDDVRGESLLTPVGDAS